MRHIQALLRHIEPYSDVFSTLVHLEFNASWKACQTCKMIRHIQSFQAFSRTFRDIQGYWCIFSHTHRRATRGNVVGFPFPFLKIGKSVLILTIGLNFWVKFFIQNVVLIVPRRKNSKMFPVEPFFLVFFWQMFIEVL